MNNGTTKGRKTTLVWAGYTLVFITSELKPASGEIKITNFYN